MLKLEISILKKINQRLIYHNLSAVIVLDIWSQKSIIETEFKWADNNLSYCFKKDFWYLFFVLLRCLDYYFSNNHQNTGLKK